MNARFKQVFETNVRFRQARCPGVDPRVADRWESGDPSEGRDGGEEKAGRGLAVHEPEEAAEEAGGEGADDEGPAEDAFTFLAVGSSHAGQQVVQPVFFATAPE